MTQRTQIWNFGGGTQSTAIAALIIGGRLPKPDLAVIVDTERELSTTWDYMEHWTRPALAEIGVELHRIKKSDWATVDLYGGKDGKSLLIPAYTNQSGETGKLPTFCSNEWKLRCVQRWATNVHGVVSAENWIGISTDEASRRATSIGSGKWIRRYVLVNLGISRNECYGIVRRMGWPAPPRSSCWMCPNHREDEWVWIKANAPEDFLSAVAFEKEAQKLDPNVWLHHSCVPLDEVDFDPKNEVLFGSCDTGLCFV